MKKKECRKSRASVPLSHFPVVGGAQAGTSTVGTRLWHNIAGAILWEWANNSEISENFIT